jgi:hypothetical protein
LVTPIRLSFMPRLALRAQRERVRIMRMEALTRRQDENT